MRKLSLKFKLGLVLVLVIIVSSYFLFEILVNKPHHAELGRGSNIPEAMSIDPNLFLPSDEGLDLYRKQLESQGKGINVKIYGRQKGVPQSDGWVTIYSTGAGFSIAAPGSAIDLRILTERKDGVSVAVDMIGFDGNGMKMRATCTREADNRAMDAALAKSLESYRGKPGELTEIEINGHKGYEIRTTSKIGLLRGRMLAIDGAMWNWAIEYSTTDDKELTPIIERFLNSFKLPPGL